MLIAENVNYMMVSMLAGETVMNTCRFKRLQCKTLSQKTRTKTPAPALIAEYLKAGLVGALHTEIVTGPSYSNPEKASVLTHAS